MAGFPTIEQLLDALAILGEEPAAYAVLLTALLLVILRDWRYALIALMVQFVLAGWLLTGILEVQQIGVLKTLVGLIICLVFYLTARQVRWGEAPPTEPAQDSNETPKPENNQNASVKLGPASINLLFRLLLGTLAAVLVLYATRNNLVTLPQVPAYVNQAALSLMVLGLVQMGITQEPLTAGVGLITTLTGFELFYHSLEQGLIVLTFLIGVDFLVAIITAYLTVAQHLKPVQVKKEGQI